MPAHVPVIHIDQRSVMTTVEEVTMKHPHFRLRVDLSNFFDDARRFCWVFVDRTRIQQVTHMKQHISKLFNIAEPFHLLLNDTEYLPPTEDVRIVKENETILVVAGSGINKVPAVVETSNASICDIQAQTTNIKTIITQDTSIESNNTSNNTQPTPLSNTTRDMTFYSVISDTVDHSQGDTDSKTADNLTEDCNITDVDNGRISVTKRKRIRKRKPKNQSQLVSPPDTTEEKIPKESKSKKPKIIDSYRIPSGKHIRFDIMESDENNIAKKIVQEVSKDESYLSNASSSRDLSALLALGQSSTPITFVNKKLKNSIKTEGMLSDEIKSKNLSKIMEDSIEKKLCKGSKKEIQNYKNLYSELEKMVPVMTRKPQIYDVIAFKTLKIGADYTPQLSNYIFTEVVGSCAESGNYTLRILYGKEEVQVPFGKFSVSEDESESHSDEDTFVLNHSQMIDLRLIS